LITVDSTAVFDRCIVLLDTAQCTCVVICTLWVVSYHTCIHGRSLVTSSWSWLTGRTSACKFISLRWAHVYTALWYLYCASKK